MMLKLLVDVYRFFIHDTVVIIVVVGTVIIVVVVVVAVVVDVSVNVGDLSNSFNTNLYFLLFLWSCKYD